MKALSGITAFILCGGLGTRLRSVVSDCPKSMALIGSRPFLEIQILQLRSQGIRRIVLGTGYLSEQIENYFQDGAAWDLEITYCREPGPLGTGGAIRLAVEQLSDPALILNGDSFCECDFRGLAQFFEDRHADFVMVTRQIENADRYGRVKTGEENRLAGFQEKNENGQPGLINCGIYLCRRDIIEAIPAGRPVSFEKEVVPAALARGCYVFETSGIFIDIGIPDDYRRAQTLLARF
jgi:D-glycero-alpha-D-manno-heptose 1-phosphate guanylyltransferase